MRPPVAAPSARTKLHGALGAGPPLAVCALRQRTWHALRESEAIREFLVRTCILDRLSAPLCDAVTAERSGSAKAMLAALVRGNLFVVPLDDRRRWYRYHHLFAEVLQTHLVDEQPELVPTLHSRASAWYAANGEPSDAIRHALAARAFATVADLVERNAPATLRNRQEPTLLGWLKSLPEELLRDRPVLSDIYAGALLSTGHFEDVEPHLRAAELGWTRRQWSWRMRRDSALASVAGARASPAWPYSGWPGITGTCPGAGGTGGLRPRICR